MNNRNGNGIFYISLICVMFFLAINLGSIIWANYQSDYFIEELSKNQEEIEINNSFIDGNLEKVILPNFFQQIMKAKEVIPSALVIFLIGMFSTLLSGIFLLFHKLLFEGIEECLKYCDIEITEKVNSIIMITYILTWVFEIYALKTWIDFASAILNSFSA